MKIIPNDDAADLMRSTLPVLREQYDKILPQLRARVFVISGEEDMRVIARVRDLIAMVPEGTDWKLIRDAVAQELERDLGEEGAMRRANILLRHHVNQIYQAGRKKAMEAQAGIFTHWEYLSVGDHRVRETHAALDGIVLPADDPFWETHFPPWEWGCRCRVRGLMLEEVVAMQEEDAAKPVEERRVLDAPQRKRLHERNELIRGPGKKINVAAPDPKIEPKEYRPRVNDFDLPVEEVLAPYPPELQSWFERWAKGQEVSWLDTMISIWDFLAMVSR